MRLVVIQDKPHDLLERKLWLFEIEFECRLSNVEAAINFFKRRDKQTFFIAEVVIDHPVVRVSRPRNLVDAAAVKAVLGKYFDGSH